MTRRIPGGCTQLCPARRQPTGRSHTGLSWKSAVSIVRVPGCAGNLLVCTVCHFFIAMLVLLLMGPLKSSDYKFTHNFWNKIWDHSVITWFFFQYSINLFSWLTICFIKMKIKNGWHVKMFLKSKTQRKSV